LAKQLSPRAKHKMEFDWIFGPIEALLYVVPSDRTVKQ